MIKVLLPVSLSLATAAPVAAGEWRFIPSIGIAEDVTDNIDETASHRRAEMVTSFQPGGAFRYTNSASTLEGTYNLDYRYYALKTTKNEANHNLAMVGNFSIVDQFLKVDVSDTFSRVSLDVARNTTTESVNHNQADQNTLIISPYLLWRMGNQVTLTTGVRYSDIRYFSGDGIDRREEGAFAQLSKEVSDRLRLTAGYVFTKTKTDPVDYNDHSVSAGFRYEYANASFIFATVGNTWQIFTHRSLRGILDSGDGRQYLGLRGTQSHIIWDAGLTRQFDTVLAALESKSRYTEDPENISTRQTTHSVKIDKIMRRSAVGLSASYDDYVSAANGFDNRHGVTIAVTGSRELTPYLTASFNVTGDKLTYQNSVGDRLTNNSSSQNYPYHLTATGSLSYLLGHETSLAVNYTYASYSHKFTDPQVVINRLLVQVRKAF